MSNNRVFDFVLGMLFVVFAVMSAFNLYLAVEANKRVSLIDRIAGEKFKQDEEALENISQVLLQKGLLSDKAKSKPKSP